MIRNFFRTAYRSILKNKVYAIINFVGLTCGLALSLLILTYLRSEFNYDRFQTKIDRLYRIKYAAPNGLELATSPPPIAPLMTEYFPEVEMAGRIYGRNVSISKPGSDDIFEETNVRFADSTIARMFTFETIEGNPELFLRDKFTVVITDEMATKYFGEESPIGQTLIFGGNHSFKVIGVVKRYQGDSHIDFNMLVPFDNMFDLETDDTAQRLRSSLAVNFIISHSYTYVLLKPGADPSNVDKNFDAFIKKYASPQLQIGQVFSLMPVKDIHLTSELLAEPTSTNSMTTIYIFIAVGMLTLVIACINYINLSTAQSFTRIKEIGIRKVLGSMKYQLISQFIAESFLFCLVAMTLSYVVFYFGLPFLNELTGQQLVFGEVVDKVMLISSGVLLVVVTLLAGGYPAYFVTQFDSINALKGAGITEHGSQILRRSLVVFQLAIASMLLCGSILIVRQLDFLSNRPLGFDQKGIITIPLFSQNLNGIFRQNDSTYRQRIQTYRDIVEAQAGIERTSLSSGVPGLGAVYNGAIPEGFTQEDNLFAAGLSVDFDFLETYGMKIVTGRSFDKDYGTDSEAFIVNETAAKEFNWGTPEDAIGKTMTNSGKTGRVVGVVSDFNFSSLTTPISAIILNIGPNAFNTMSVRVSTNNVQEVIEKLETEWNRLFPEKGFQYTFLEEQLGLQYQNFQNFGTIIQTFAMIAILISCLGVYGLVLFVVQRKVKEIGVRKVLGASISSILRLIYSDFLGLLLVGFVLSMPVSYYLLENWLENFSYRVSIDWFVYVLSFTVVSLIVTATVGYQAIRASLANPVKSLRSE